MTDRLPHFGCAYSTAADDIHTTVENHRRTRL